MRRRHTAEPTLKLRNNVFSSRCRTGTKQGRVTPGQNQLFTPRPETRPRVSLSWLIPDLALLPHRTWSALPGPREALTVEAAVPMLTPKPHPSFPQTESPESTEYRAEYPRDPFRYLWAGAPYESPRDARRVPSL